MCHGTAGQDARVSEKLHMVREAPGLPKRNTEALRLGFQTVLCPTASREHPSLIPGISQQADTVFGPSSHLQLERTGVPGGASVTVWTLGVMEKP